MFFIQINRLWCPALACFACFCAAGMECAARRRVNRAWNRTFERGQLIHTKFFKLGNRIKQCLCIRMLRIAEHLCRRAELSNFPEIHYGNFVGHLAHNAKVMRNQDVRELELFLQFPQQFEYLRVREQIDDRFIQHHQFGV